MTVLNTIEFAKGKKMSAQAELAVAFTLNELRHTKSLSNTVVKELETDKGEVNHVGSYFYSTDQLGMTHFSTETFHNHDKSRFDNMNIHKDIDLALSSVYKITSEGRTYTKTFGIGTTISCKKMDTAMWTGNLSLELKTFNNSSGQSREGWFRSSSANYYAFVIGTNLIMVKKDDLVKLSTEKEWCISRGLTKKVQATNSNRFYDNAENLLIPVDDVAKIGTVIPIAPWYAKRWSAGASVEERAANKKLTAKLFSEEF